MQTVTYLLEKVLEAYTRLFQASKVSNCKLFSERRHITLISSSKVIIYQQNISGKKI